MEAHAVHYNSKYKDFAEAVNKPDGLAVTGFFIQACGDKACPEFAKTTEGIRNVQLPNTKTALDSGELVYYLLCCCYCFISVAADSQTANTAAVELDIEICIFVISTRCERDFFYI